MRGLFYSPDSLGGVIALVLQLLGYAILIRALLSWFVRDPYNPVVQALDAITEPILRPLRQIMPRVGMFDFTPMVAMIVLFLLAAMVHEAWA